MHHTASSRKQIRRALLRGAALFLLASLVVWAVAEYQSEQRMQRAFAPIADEMSKRIPPGGGLAKFHQDELLRSALPMAVMVRERGEDRAYYRLSTASFATRTLPTNFQDVATVAEVTCVSDTVGPDRYQWKLHCRLINWRTKTLFAEHWFTGSVPGRPSAQFNRSGQMQTHPISGSMPWAELSAWIDEQMQISAQGPAIPVAHAER
jgi:hypothetical protein